MDIKPQSLWTYVGSQEDARGTQKHYAGSLHIVVGVYEEHDQVVTWCKKPAITWIGDQSEFLVNFKPANGKFEFV